MGFWAAGDHLRGHMFDIRASVLWVEDRSCGNFWRVGNLTKDERGHELIENTYQCM